MQDLKDFLAPKTVNRFSYVAILGWLFLGIVLSGIFLDIEINESRADFRCGSEDANKEVISGKCYEQYEKRNNKFGIPVYGFVIINFLVTASVCGIYSQAVKSRVNELEASTNAGEEGQTRQEITGPTRKKLFIGYCCQLVVRFLLALVFVLLQAKLLYSRSFPSNFNCNLIKEGNFTAAQNVKRTQTSYECHNQRAAKKTFWANAVIVVNGVLMFLVFIEVLCIVFLWVRKGQRFLEDLQFHNSYLKSNSRVFPETQQQELIIHRNDTPSEPQQSSAPSNNEQLSFNCTETNEQTPVATFIERMKEHVLSKTERHDRDPFDPKPGEGCRRDQTLDQIYTNLMIHEGRIKYDLTGEREEQLYEYTKPREHSPSTLVLAGDIFDAEKQNILVVGRPGIGKTMFSTKILRNWASNSLFTEAQKSPVDFKVAFFIKLRRFNSKQDEKFSLRELLSHSEYSAKDLTEEVWNYILQNPNKVLVIFDGFDEYSGKTKIDEESHSYRYNEEAGSMPIHILFMKIASGDILRGATVLTTTRPNAVSFISSLHFHKTVEILGFTTDQVDDYVQKFTKGDDQKANTIKQHIKSNLNLLSFCYIPVNCFIICSCLFQLLNNTNSDSPGLLPTTLTEVYSIAVKFFYFRHHIKENNIEKIFLKPFTELSSTVQKLFKRLGKIAFDGIEKGKLVFESHEVNDLGSNGLFHRLPDSRDRPLAEPRPQYCFLHLTIQEFLAAKYLVDTYSSEDLQKFVSDHIQDGAWKVVMQFVAGLLAEKEGQSTDIFSDLLPPETDTYEVKIKMNEDSEERTEILTCWPAGGHRLLVVTLFNCMYENKASDRKVQKKLVKIGCNALDFRRCNLSPLDCLALVHALKSVEGILDFNLYHNNLQSLGCIEIAKLLPGNQHNQGFRGLKRLNLGDNNITDEGVKHLSTALTHTNCTLNSLNLGGNNITDEGVKHLSTALTHTNCTLNSLILGYNNITDEGVKHLSTALTNTNCTLNSLNLGENNITDKGKNLVKSMNISSKSILLFLNLKLNKITDECIKRFNASTALTYTNCKRNKA
ncbi:unnamed protein product [Porites lobata]|uniref:NACHT domain-containing protein n=1 Tax=Porites lobata TaxID=104759 RepID=A0ABN8NRH0_9CNID|nr:unnamed protein product [Porites lobata]